MESPDSRASDDPNYNLEFADDVLSSPDDHLETRNTYSDYEQDLEDVMRLGVPISILEGGDEDHTVGAPLQNEDDHPTDDVEASVAENDAEAMRATTANPNGAPATPVGGLTVTDNFGPTGCTPMPPSTPLPGSEVAVLARADARVPRTSILNYLIAGTTPHGPGRRDDAPPTGAAVSVRHASARSPEDATPMDTSQVELSAPYGFADASLREPVLYDESEIACQGSIRIERANRRAQELPDLHSQPDRIRGLPEFALADARNGAVRSPIAARARSPDTAPSIDVSCAINSGQVTMSTIDDVILMASQAEARETAIAGSRASPSTRSAGYAPRRPRSASAPIGESQDQDASWGLATQRPQPGGYPPDGRDTAIDAPESLGKLVFYPHLREGETKAIITPATLLASTVLCTVPVR